MKKENRINGVIRWIIENVLWDYAIPILSLLASSIIQFLLPEDLLPMFNWYITYPVYFIFAYGLFQIIADLKNFFSNRKLLNLAKARTDGVILRNEGVAIQEILETKRWIEKFDGWDDRTIKLISRISKVESENFKVINRFKLTSGNITPIVQLPIHRKKVNVLEEKLARLEQLIEKVNNNEIQ